MIRNLVFVLLLLPPVLASAQPGKEFPTGTAGTDYNVRDTRGKQGPWIRVYKTQPDVLYYRGQFKNNVPTGTFVFYTPTGLVKSEVDHVQDTTINDVRHYHPDGVTIMSQGRYVGKKEGKSWIRQKQGTWKLYNDKGLLVAEESYVDDQLDGTCKYYYDNGKLVSITTFSAGKKQGPFTDYFDNGKKQREGTFYQEEYDGHFTSWNENGSKASEGTYIRGVADGTWYFFGSNGQLEISILYTKGAETKRRYENGTFTEYYDSGIPKSEFTYENGKKDGPFTEWYDQGQFVLVPGSKEDMELGIMNREKLEGTQVKCEGDYMDDHLEGEIVYYTEKGQIDRVEIWEGGVLKETRTGR